MRGTGGSPGHPYSIFLVTWWCRRLAIRGRKICSSRRPAHRFASWRRQTRRLWSEWRKERKAATFVFHLAEELVLLGFLEHPLPNALDSKHRSLSASINRALEDLHRRVLPEHISEAEGPEEIWPKVHGRARERVGQDITTPLYEGWDVQPISVQSFKYQVRVTLDDSVIAPCGAITSLSQLLEPYHKVTSINTITLAQPTTGRPVRTGGGKQRLSKGSVPKPGGLLLCRRCLQARCCDTEMYCFLEFWDIHSQQLLQDSLMREAILSWGKHAHSSRRIHHGGDPRDQACTCVAWRSFPAGASSSAARENIVARVSKR